MRRVTTATVIALGFLLGMRHATDADHVIAISTIITRQRRLRAGILIGALWGVGHTLTIAVIGGAIILFRVVIPPGVGLTMEMTVALMLVVLGLAGSAAVALLGLAAIGDPHWAVAYLLLFGIDTIVGMMLITLVLAAPMTYASRRLRHVERHLRVASGVLSLAFGLFLVYHIGFVSGLFTGHASWTPH